MTPPEGLLCMNQRVTQGSFLQQQLYQPLHSLTLCAIFSTISPAAVLHTKKLSMQIVIKVINQAPIPYPCQNNISTLQLRLSNSQHSSTTSSTRSAERR